MASEEFAGVGVDGDEFAVAPDAGVLFVRYGEAVDGVAHGFELVGYVGGDTGEYVRHHNPFTYLSDVFNSSVQKLNLVPFTQFATDLNNNALPDISFVIPNLIDDAHDGTLPAQQLCKGAPWIIRLQDIERKDVRVARKAPHPLGRNCGAEGGTAMQAGRPLESTTSTKGGTQKEAVMPTAHQTKTKDRANSGVRVLQIRRGVAVEGKHPIPIKDVVPHAL